MSDTARTTPAAPVTLAGAPGRWVLAATVLASGMAFLDATIVTVALPAIGEDLGAEVAGLQWVLTGYLVTLAALILLGGSLGDHYGRRRVFVWGVVAFAVASAACAAAPTVGALVAARLLQGVGGALLTPGSLAIIQASFAAADRPAAIGAWSGLAGVTTAVGPLVGGWLIEVSSWRWVFLINLPLAVAVVAIALWHVPESRDPAAEPFDPLGGVLATAALAAGTWALIAAGDRGAGDVLVLGVGALAVLLLVTFVGSQVRSPHPMLPPSIFSSSQFTAANLVTVAVYAALGVASFLLVVQLQAVLGYSALAAGLSLLPVTILMLLLSSSSGSLAQRIGPRAQMTVGPLLAAGGLALMVRVGPGADYATTVLPAASLLGLGLAVVVAPLTATVLAAVDDRHAGLASGVNNAVARTAQLAAVAVLPVVAGLTGDAFQQPAVMTAGFRTAMWISAGLAATGGLLAFATIRNPLAGDAAPAGEAPAVHCAMDAPPLDQCPRPAGPEPAGAGLAASGTGPEPG